MNKTSLYQSLIISLLLHLVVVLLTTHLPPNPDLGPRALDVEIVYQDETPKQRVTDPDPLKNEINKLKEQARLLSRVTRRVQDEQVARKKGTTQNASQAAQNITTPPPRPSITAPMSEELQANSRPISVSSIADFIPEVREGGFTSLNTEQFMFYTFYARIDEQVRNRWVNNIRQILRHLPASELSLLAQKRQVTQVEIILTKDGKFVKAIVHKKSDSYDLDAAAAAAFQLAAPFNNPPLEIVDPEDDHIHLHYQFHLQFRPRYMAGQN